MYQRGDIVVAKLIALFAIIGLGLGVGALVFLWGIDFFSQKQSEGMESFGAAFAGGIVISAVLIFAMLVGLVLAGLGGMWAAGQVNKRSTASMASAIGGMVGYVVLVGAVGVSLIVGISAATAASESAAPEPSPSPTLDQECVDLFGADSPLCGASVNEPSGESADSAESLVTAEGILKMLVGVLPAALVGALSGAVSFSRKKDEQQPSALAV